MLVMLLCANKLHAQEKKHPKTQAKFTKPKPYGLDMPPKPICPDTNWLLGKFDQTPLLEMLCEVSKWYKVKVDSNSIPKDNKVSGTLNKNLPLLELLDALNEVNHTKLIVKDGVISNQQ